MPSSKTSKRSREHSTVSDMLIDVDNVSLAFGGETILDNISLGIVPGEFIGVVGPNGAGKSSLLRVMLGLWKQDSGQVRRRKTRIGYIPQRGYAKDNQVPMNVFEVVCLGSRGNKPAATKALQAVDMLAAHKKRINELSGGQQQRVLIAQALAGNPDILILDEPTTGIDESSQNMFYQILKNLQNSGMTIVMVSHDVDMVLKTVTRVICINHAIIYDGQPEHFEPDEYMPKLYGDWHRQLHHQHDQTIGGSDA